MVEILKGRIAAFLSQSKVAINIGLENGVKKGMKFVIYDEGDLILDPETRAPLEKLELIKGRITITSVQEKISIGESFKFVTTSPAALRDAYDFFETLGSITQSTSKRVDIVLTDVVFEALQPEPIKIGDLVRQVRQVISKPKDAPSPST